MGPNGTENIESEGNLLCGSTAFSHHSSSEKLSHDAVVQIRELLPLEGRP